jgi:hypothetical protein
MSPNLARVGFDELLAADDNAARATARVCTPRRPCCSAGHWGCARASPRSRRSRRRLRFPVSRPARGTYRTLPGHESATRLSRFALAMTVSSRARDLQGCFATASLDGPTGPYHFPFELPVPHPEQGRVLRLAMRRMAKEVPGSGMRSIGVMCLAWSADRAYKSPDSCVGPTRESTAHRRSDL